MPVHSNLPLLLAQANVERVKRGESPLSLRRLAHETGVSLSVLTALNTDRNQRIDYSTIDKLLSYFNTYCEVTTADLLSWKPT